jgi:RNA polymerase sigma-54 factor
MNLLQPKLNLRLGQRQVLTPGLMQMVSVLALNKLELREMINAEIVENPVLEEVDECVPLIDDLAAKEGDRERSAEEHAADAEREKKDPFDEIDFGSYFQDYLDPGFRTTNNHEELDSPSFENFLTQPGTLTDHLIWQLGSLSLTDKVRRAAEYIIGNLNEDGYLTFGDEELLEGFLRELPQPFPSPQSAEGGAKLNGVSPNGISLAGVLLHGVADTALENPVSGDQDPALDQARIALHEALAIVQNLDPVGIATRDLRECLLVQIKADADPERQIGQSQVGTAVRIPEIPSHQGLSHAQNGSGNSASREDKSGEADSPISLAANGAPIRDESPDKSANLPRLQLIETAERIVDRHLSLLQKKDLRELARVAGRTTEQVQTALDYIRTLDPRPGQRYNNSAARLISPDVAFVKRGDEYVVVMNEEELPTLRLNHQYRKMLVQPGADREVKDYVKERYRSAIQLLRNIEQRKNTIMRTCESIIRRQRDFLEEGVDAMKPMMIKEVAEEIGVHPSTVSRAVSNKYVHTSQGVFELRFFFSEGVNGPEGAGTPLMLLKRKVKKLIEDENPRKPLTDDQLAAVLQSQGIDVTRRTVAKYREDLHIPSTHQRRVRD